MGHQPQVVADEPVPRGSVTGLQRRKGGLFLGRVQRARKAAALQPQSQVSDLPAAACTNTAKIPNIPPPPGRVCGRMAEKKQGTIFFSYYRRK